MKAFNVMPFAESICIGKMDLGFSGFLLTGSAVFDMKMADWLSL